MAGSVGAIINIVGVAGATSSVCVVGWDLVVCEMMVMLVVLVIVCVTTTTMVHSMRLSVYVDLLLQDAELWHKVAVTAIQGAMGLQEVLVKLAETLPARGKQWVTASSAKAAEVVAIFKEMYNNGQ